MGQLFWQQKCSKRLRSTTLYLADSKWMDQIWIQHQQRKKYFHKIHNFYENNFILETPFDAQFCVLTKVTWLIKPCEWGYATCQMNLWDNFPKMGSKNRTFAFWLIENILHTAKLSSFQAHKCRWNFKRPELTPKLNKTSIA